MTKRLGRLGRPAAVVTFCGLAGLLAFLIVAKPWRSLFANFEERRAEDQMLAPLIEQARASGLSYLEVYSSESGRVGQPVLWCVDHHSVGQSWVGGNAQYRLSWTNEDSVPVGADSKHGCRDMVAVVRGADSSGVLLEFKGLP